MKIRQLLLLFSMFSLVCIYAYAQDPTQVAPGKYKMILENDRVRVLEVRITPGDSIGKHSHPDHIAYSVGACTLSITGPDGKAQEISMKDGEALWLPATTHSAVNSGKTDCRVAVIELKEPAPKK
jgi:quercetin dioxygenase-like cupin family protein